MRSLTKSLVSFLKKEDGPTAVEYAVMQVSYKHLRYHET
jgi:hypothetical protein